MRRRSAANQQAAGVSLFPFLAVLLCTMGALIVVLVVIARHAHLQVAEAARRAAAEAAKGDLAIAREDLEWRISELTKSRAATKKMLDEKQLELSHIEEHTRRIRDKLEELAAAKAHFHELAAGDAKENEELKARLARLRSDAGRTKAQIDDLRGKAGRGGESYAIIPYHGPNETHRRPIYVECRKEGVVLQPEGIVLTADDFAVDVGPSNPLVSALRAARDYHARNQLMHRSEAATPYPLFIIRPDGIEMSYLARAAMVSWGPEFGYELIGQDWPLEYPPPEPMLALAMKQAVSEGRMRQAYIARAAPMLSRTGSHATFRASAHGGITQVDGSPGGSGRRSSGRPRGVAGRRGPGGGQPGGGQSASGSGNFVGSGSGDGPVHSIDGSDNPYESALASSPPAGTYARGATALAGNSSAQPGGRYPGRNDGGFLPGDGTSQQAAGTNGYSSPYGRGDGRYGNGTGNGQGAVGKGTGSGQGAFGNGNSAAPESGKGLGTGAAQRAGSDNGLAGSGSSPSGGSDNGNGAGGAGNTLAGMFGKGTGSAGTGTGGALASTGRGGSNGRGGSGERGGSGQGKEPAGGIVAGTNRGAAGLNGGRSGGSTFDVSGKPGGNAFTGGTTGSNEPGAPGSSGNPGGTVGEIPSNTGATAPGGPYRMAASGANSKGASGPGNSGPASDAAGRAGTDGSTAPASPNGFAGGRVVDNGQTNAQGTSAKAGGGTSATGSSNPTVLSESRGAVGGRAGGASASGSRGSTRGQMAGGASGGASGSSSARSSTASGQPSGFGGSASSMQAPQAGGLPMPNMNFGQQNPQSPESIAKKRDRNWANPDASTSSIPIERPIRIVCDAEHLTLLPEGRGRQGMRVIPFKRQTVESVDDLVSTVWDRIDSWGTAGRGMYWRPVLLMEVEPGGQRRYAELQALLADSGFDVHGKPRRHFFIPPRTVNARQR